MSYQYGGYGSYGSSQNYGSYGYNNAAPAQAANRGLNSVRGELERMFFTIADAKNIPVKTLMREIAEEFNYLSNVNNIFPEYTYQHSDPRSGVSSFFDQINGGRQHLLCYFYRAIENVGINPKDYKADWNFADLDGYTLPQGKQLPPPRQNGFRIDSVPQVQVASANAAAQPQPASRGRTVELEKEISRLSDKITSLERSLSQAESSKSEKDREIVLLRQHIQTQDSVVGNLKSENVYLSTQNERLQAEIARLQAASQPVLQSSRLPQNSFSSSSSSQGTIPFAQIRERLHQIFQMQGRIEEFVNKWNSDQTITPPYLEHFYSNYGNPREEALNFLNEFHGLTAKYSLSKFLKVIEKIGWSFEVDGRYIKMPQIKEYHTS